MRRIPTTYFIKNIGTFLRGDPDEAVVVTSHGRDSAVLLSAREYQRLLAAAKAASPKDDAQKPPPRRDNDPLTTALSVVSTSVRTPVTKDALLRALKGRSRRKAVSEIFFADVGAQTMAALVNRGYVTWRELEAAMAGLKGVDREKASYVREMVGFELADAPGIGTAPAR